MNRKDAKILGLSEYHGKRCGIDGSRYYDTDTGKCSECRIYAQSYNEKYVVGTKGEGDLTIPREFLKLNSTTKQDEINRACDSRKSKRYSESWAPHKSR